MVLLIGAGLLIQSFMNVLRVNPGFDPRNLLNITVSLNPKTNRDPENRLAHLRELLDAFRSIPGVESAAAVNHVPLTGEVDIHNPAGGGKAFKRTEGRWRISRGRCQLLPHHAHSAGCGARVPGGRAGRDSPSSIARWRLIYGRARMLSASSSGMAATRPVTVVGIVGDIHNGSLESEPRMQFYLPLAADPWSGQCFMIRTRIDPAAILPAAQQTVWRLDPEAPVSHPQTMERLPAIRNAWTGDLRPAWLRVSPVPLYSLRQWGYSASLRFPSRGAPESLGFAWHSVRRNHRPVKAGIGPYGWPLLLPDSLAGLPPRWPWRRQWRGFSME